MPTSVWSSMAASNANISPEVVVVDLLEPLAAADVLLDAFLTCNHAVVCHDLGVLQHANVVRGRLRISKG